MIIDTESTEGRALVALAKFGKWALDTSREYCTDVDGGDIQDAATELGLLRGVEVTEESLCGNLEMCRCAIGDECYRYTDLAKMPEGIWKLTHY